MTLANGRSSRAKGVRGEHESAGLFELAGGVVLPIQNNVPETIDYLVRFGDVTLAVDSKLRKRVDILAASRDIEAAVIDGYVPAVAYRHTMPPGQRAQPWRISMRLEDVARLLGGAT